MRTGEGNPQVQAGRPSKLTATDLTPGLPPFLPPHALVKIFNILFSEFRFCFMAFLEILRSPWILHDF